LSIRLSVQSNASFINKKNAISDIIAAISSFICVLVFGVHSGECAPNFFCRFVTSAIVILVSVCNFVKN